MKSILLLLLAATCVQVSAEGRSCVEWLLKYDWLKMPVDSEPTKNDIRDALRNMKEFYNMEVNGDCDEATINFMQRARCGNSDASPSKLLNTKRLRSRKRRWVRIPDVPLWTDPAFGFQMPLTIGFKNYHPAMTQSAQDSALMYCATRWAEVSGLSFQLVFTQTTANIFLEFVPSLDDDPGPLGVLALAESPTPFRDPPESRIKFDSRESWVPTFTPNQSPDVIIFQAVLCHEMGHTLALDHTNDPSAVMFAELVNQNSQVRLGTDDITGIQALYGPANGVVIVNAPSAPSAPSVSSSPPAPTPFPPTPPAPTFAPFVPPSVNSGRAGACSEIINRRRRQACFDGSQRRRNSGRGRRGQGRNRRRNRRGGRRNRRFG